MEKIIIPALDEERMQEVRAGFAKIDKPAANLGKLEDMVVALQVCSARIYRIN